MTYPQIDDQVTSNSFVIRDTDGFINSNYRAFDYFMKILKANFVEDLIYVKYTEENKYQLLDQVTKILRKYGIELSSSDEIREINQQYYAEKENFLRFSESAFKIRNNIVDAQDLDYFTSALKRKLTFRTLYDLQLLSSYHLAFSQNSCNFSVPGSGKTSIVFGAFSYLSGLSEENSKYVNKLFVVGPLSSFGPWEDEYENCFGRKPYSRRLSGGISKSERDATLLSVDNSQNTPEMLLISYPGLCSDYDNIITYLSKPSNKVMMVLDEAHRIKNTEEGLWAQTVLSLAKYCKSRVVLTGTPAPNGYEDLYNLYKFIWPQSKIINYSPRQLKDMTQNRFDYRVNDLISSISPFFIRIRKSDLHLPSFINHKPDFIEMNPAQKEIYNLIENRYLFGYVDDHPDIDVSKSFFKARLVRLMQAASNPVLLKYSITDYYLDGEKITSDESLDNDILRKIDDYLKTNEYPTKYWIILSMVQDIIKQNQKVVIWGLYIQSIKELQKFLNNNGINSELLIGETPVEVDTSQDEIRTRECIIRDFNNTKIDLKVIIANPMAVAESISIHKACHNAIYFERNFNAAYFIQSKDRIHRVGLPEGVSTNYYYLISQDTVEETIHKSLLVKEERMLQILESQEIPLFTENMNYDIDINSDFKLVIKDYVNRVSENH